MAVHDGRVAGVQRPARLVLEGDLVAREVESVIPRAENGIQADQGGSQQNGDAGDDQGGDLAAVPTR
jgi:hypothetical protein